MKSVLFEKPVVSWALYDWANSAFATTVIAGFFPVFFKGYWSADTEATITTFRLGVANGIASLVIALFAPVIGAIADRGSARKKFLFTFTALGIVMTSGLYFVAAGAWPVAAALFVFASMGFAGANIFYDSLLVDVARRDKYDLVSAYGFSLGYLGGALLFLVNALMTIYPHRFGLADQAQAVRIAFLSVAGWWLVFSLPLLFFVHEGRPPEAPGPTRAVRDGLAQLAATFREARGLRDVFLFLLAYWLYIDGVNTVIKMAVDYGLSLGFPVNSLLIALLVTNVVGFPAALVFGWLGERFGTRRGILVAIGIYIAVTIWAVFLSSVTEFYAMAVAIGLVQGGVQSLSRSLFARLIPEDKSAEFFGFYNMVGKFAAVLGPFLVAGFAYTTGSSRAAIFSIVILFVAGGWLLTRVDAGGRGETVRET
ncbi:MFS transporter [soil metagenome]